MLATREVLPIFLVEEPAVGLKRGQDVKALSEELIVLEPLDLSYDGSAIVGYEGEPHSFLQQEGK